MKTKNKSQSRAGTQARQKTCLSNMPAKAKRSGSKNRAAANFSGREKFFKIKAKAKTHTKAKKQNKPREAKSGSMCQAVSMWLHMVPDCRMGYSLALSGFWNGHPSPTPAFGVGGGCGIWSGQPIPAHGFRAGMGCGISNGHSVRQHCWRTLCGCLNGPPSAAPVFGAGGGGFPTTEAENKSDAEYTERPAASCFGGGGRLPRSGGFIKTAAPAAVVSQLVGAKFGLADVILSCHIKVLPKIMYIRKTKDSGGFSYFKNTAIFPGIELIKGVQPYE